MKKDKYRVDDSNWMCSSPYFLVKGLRNTGKKGIPIEYERVLIIARNEDEVIQRTKGIDWFRVYKIGNEHLSQEEVERTRAKDEEIVKENEERRLLSILKSKYPDHQ